jgi:hypothetical protein
MSALPIRCRPVDYIIELVATSFEIDREMMVNVSRLQKYVGPRQIAMMLAKELLNYELTRIGKMFNRDHSTVFHGIERARERARDDVEVAEKVRLLRERLIRDLQVADDVRNRILGEMLDRGAGCGAISSTPK